MTEQEYLLMLNMVPGLGPVRIARALEKVRPITDLDTLSDKSLGAISGWNGAVVESFRAFDREKFFVELKKIENSGVKILTVLDEGYPSRLAGIYDPPPVIYLRGNSDLLERKGIAIVGARRASSYGAALARRLSAEIASLGINIVSGLAVGIDSTAHEAAVRCGGGTIAVLGSGFDRLYPTRNRTLFEQIQERGGAVISEFPLSRHADRQTFPRRNRIISGLSWGVLVVEAGLKSGSLITARYAMEQGREVFACPGPAGTPLAAGTNQLIRDGAVLVESVEDVIEAFDWNIRPDRSQRKTVSLGEKEEKVYRHLSFHPVHVEELVVKSGLRFPEVAGVLVNLQINTLVRQLPGQYYVLR